MIAARLLPSGDRGILVEVRGLEEALALAASLGRARPEGVLDLVPAARTVLVVIDPARLPLPAASRWIRDAAEQTSVGDGAATGPLREIAVHYDGEDLAETAALLGWSTAELVGRHTATLWRAAFGGFAPGFAYLVALGPWPEVPRRTEPRPRVPTGSVALASGYSGVYPRSSPGGWQLIGSSEATLWDAERVPPALLAPGDTVRFVAVP